MRPNTTLLNVSPGPVGSMSTIRSSRHSMLAGEAATRGGFTITLGALSSPASSNSSAPYGASIELRFICSRRSQVTRFVTNSPVSRTLTMVSFSCRSAGALHEKITTGGAVETRLKCENGARFTCPLRLIVLIQPIGRGATIALNSVRLKSCVVAGSRNIVISLVDSGCAQPRTPPFTNTVFPVP